MGLTLSSTGPLLCNLRQPPGPLWSQCLTCGTGTQGGDSAGGCCEEVSARHISTTPTRCYFTVATSSRKPILTSPGSRGLLAPRSTGAATAPRAGPPAPPDSQAGTLTMAEPWSPPGVWHRAGLPPPRTSASPDWPWQVLEEPAPELLKGAALGARPCRVSSWGSNNKRKGSKDSCDCSLCSRLRAEPFGPSTQQPRTIIISISQMEKLRHRGAHCLPPHTETESKQEVPDAEPWVPAVSLANPLASVYPAQHPRRCLFRLPGVPAPSQWDSLSLQLVFIQALCAENKKMKRKLGSTPPLGFQGRKEDPSCCSPSCWGPELPTACPRSHSGVGDRTLALDSPSSALPLPGPAFAVLGSVLQARGEQRVGADVP
nr:uncharacterized protein LOC105872280 isoform X1 [Microcebus murinus]